MWKRVGSFVAVLVAAVALVSGTASADTVDVVVDSGPVTLSKADDGTHTAKVTIVNTSDAKIPVDVEHDKTDAGCTITPSPTTLGAGSRTTVTLTLTMGCDVASGKDIVLTFDGATPGAKTIVADPPPDTTPDWSILAWALGVGLVLTLTVDIWVLIRIDEVNRTNATRQSEVPPPVIIGPGTMLSGLGTSWSFKDSWVSNVTLGASALIALFAASDILTSVVGEKPTAAIGLMAVAAGVSAVCVTVGPLILKAVGGEVAVPIAAGTVIASSVVLFGTFTQVGAVTIQAAALVNREWLEYVLGAVGIAIAIVVGIYGGAALGGFMKTGAERTPAPPSPEEKAAQIIVDAFFPPPPPPAGVMGVAPIAPVVVPTASEVWTPPTARTAVL
jgi:hypothetical protein